MPRNGSGVYTLPEADFVSGTTISSTATNSNNGDLETALTGSIAADGQTTITANLPLNSKKITGLADGTAASDAAVLHQIQDQDGIWCGTAGGTADAITLTPSPAITVYAAGQWFVWIAGGSPNTGAMTIAVSGLAAQAAQSDGAALAAGDHAAGKMYAGRYDGTQFQIQRIINPSAFAATILDDADAAAARATLDALQDVMTTRGDITVEGASGPARLAVGTNGQVLKSDGTDPVWGTADAGASATDMRLAFQLIAESAGTAVSMVDGVSDAFVTETNVNTGASSGASYDSSGDFYTTESIPATAYANAGGQGDRTGSITVTTNMAIDSGTADNLVDGATGNNATNSVDFTTVTLDGSQYVRFDFGASNNRHIDEFTLDGWMTINGTYKWQASANATDWTDVSASFTWDSATKVVTGTIGAAASYRYYQLVGLSGSNSNVFWEEITFKISTPTTSNMTLRSTSFTAGSAPSTGSIHIQVKENESVTINTDLLADISRDGGATWTTATLALVGTLLDGTKAYEDGSVDISGQPSGTSLEWRIRTANNKHIEAHGALLQWA